MLSPLSYWSVILRTLKVDSEFKSSYKDCSLISSDHMTAHEYLLSPVSWHPFSLYGFASTRHLCGTHACRQAKH